MRLRLIHGPSYWQSRAQAKRDQFAAASIADVQVQAAPSALEHVGAVGNLAVLTPRERQVAQLNAEGFSGKEIARLLGITDRTVEMFKGLAIKKIGARNGAHLAALTMAANVVAARHNTSPPTGEPS